MEERKMGERKKKNFFNKKEKAEKKLKKQLKEGKRKWRLLVEVNLPIIFRRNYHFPLFCRTLPDSSQTTILEAYWSALKVCSKC